jgi:hypothetical protein
VIVGTAGHIDHGKTALLLALTALAKEPLLLTAAETETVREPLSLPVAVAAAWRRRQLQQLHRPTTITMCGCLLPARCSCASRVRQPGRAWRRSSWG